MSTRMTFVAHAATASTRAGSFPFDEPLDDRAMLSAAALAPQVRDARRVWTSSALCARQTAEAMGLAAEVAPSIDDCGYGAWAGRTLTDVATVDAANLAAWTTDPDAAPPGGESVVGLIARVGPWLDLRLQEKGQSVAVTHAAIIRAAIVHALKVPAHTFWRIDVMPATLTELRPNGGRWMLRSLNIAPVEPS